MLMLLALELLLYCERTLRNVLAGHGAVEKDVPLMLW